MCRIGECIRMWISQPVLNNSRVCKNTSGFGLILSKNKKFSTLFGFRVLINRKFQQVFLEILLVTTRRFGHSMRKSNKPEFQLNCSKKFFDNLSYTFASIGRVAHWAGYGNNGQNPLTKNHVDRTTGSRVIPNLGVHKFADHQVESFKFFLNKK